MSRLMSVSLTEDAVRARTKTVTRRLGWRFAKPGDRVTLCRKVMGRKPGEPLVRICDVEIVDIRREVLLTMPYLDVAREGFSDWTREQFAAFDPATSDVTVQARATALSHTPAPAGGRNA